ncbi:MAG: glycosyltransferase family 4 protein [Clostridia bacterium]|nr:glycosyltransferase family 4 protein [Clostridia bacterium]
MVVRDFKVQRTKILVSPNPANIVNFYRDPKIEKENKLVFVGSLEERKGAAVLAKALNIVFESFPNFSIDFIGKDTTRNSQNISTVRLVRSLVNTEHQDKLNFLGQLPNEELNYYLNRAMVGIYPSLFDNFPYVCLEGMAVGLHVVGSKNSGMVEMLEDPDSIYDTGDSNDLAFKIIKKIKLAQRESVNKKNIDRVKTEYDPKKVCSDLVNVYKYVITEYIKKYTSTYEIATAVKELKLGKLISFAPENRSLANFVFNVKTDKGYVELKKYLYDYDFDLARLLYDKYEEAKINVIRPINKAFYNNGYLNYAAFK